MNKCADATKHKAVTVTKPTSLSTNANTIPTKTSEVRLMIEALFYGGSPIACGSPLSTTIQSYST